VALVTDFLAGIGVVPVRLERPGPRIIQKLGISHPLVSRDLLESYSMNETDFRVSGSSTKWEDTELSILDHSIFTIRRPSEKGLPLPGMPSLDAFIIAGFLRIALIPSPVSLTATSCLDSYPMNSENATPFSAFTVQLSCAARAMRAKKERDATTITNAEMILILHLHYLLLFI
jgi:hypothetical protein